jgi:hypothetical protein
MRVYKSDCAINVLIVYQQRQCTSNVLIIYQQDDVEMTLAECHIQHSCWYIIRTLLVHYQDIDGTVYKESAGTMLIVDE